LDPEILIAAGRIIFGLFFVIAGVRNFAGFTARTNLPTNYGWPLPAPLLAAGFTTQLLGGLALIAGLWTAWGAIALILFLIVATPLYHNLFRFKGAERLPHLYFTLVNITLSGGLLQIIANAA